MREPLLGKPGSTVALAGCSDPLPRTAGPMVEQLQALLEAVGLRVIQSPGLWAEDPREKGEALLACYENPDISAVFDLSGGDLANALLPYLDFRRIARSGLCLWGYSDLTAVLNAIYARTGRPSVLYQVRNLLRPEAPSAAFVRTVRDGKDDLFQLPVRFLRGTRMEGTLVGGNLRCFLKLAGTPYWPDLRGKLLLLEANSGTFSRLRACLCQLSQMGALSQTRGILLGTFTELEAREGRARLEQLVLELTETAIPVAVTGKIGHGPDALAALIGGHYHIIQDKERSLWIEQNG